ncbi:hypothetical protein F5Y10DRAFT_75774 [Nemania abortiva]|nr:hypothetical protein F5Y10DRAFT_75774 [Nemania abortiva]
MDDANEFLHGLQSNDDAFIWRIPDFSDFRYEGDGDTVLHRAAYGGLEIAATSLLRNDKWKHLINEPNNDDLTALHYLCINYQELSGESGGQDKTSKILKTLLENGADINRLGGNNRWTPLHVAIYARSSFLVREMLATGRADVNKPTFSHGARPLHIAVDRNSPDITRALIDTGADLKLTTHNGESVLHAALETAYYLEQGGRTEPPVETTTKAPVQNTAAADNSQASSDYGQDYGNKVSQGAIARDNTHDQHGHEAQRIGINEIIGAIISRDKWFQLLQVAYRESDLDFLKFALRKLYPDPNDYENKESVVRRLWMAMREERFKDLEEELRAAVRANDNVPQNTLDCCACWNALDLSTYLGIPQLVRWLLRSKRWSKLEKEMAMSHFKANESLPCPNDLGPKSPIWAEPFVKYSGTDRNKYGYPSGRPKHATHLTALQSSVLDIYNDGKQFGFLCHSSEVRELLYSGEGARRGPRASMEAKTKCLKEEVPGFGTGTYDPESFRFRWIHLPANCIQWMIDAATITYREKDTNTREIMKGFRFFKNSWYELPERGSERKYMNPLCASINFPKIETNKSTTDKRKTDKSEPDGAMDLLAIYIPYIKCAPKPRPGSRDLSGFKAVIDTEDQKLPFHEPQTLDTYHHGKDAAQRDSDQVLSRYVKELLQERLQELHSELSQNELDAKYQNSDILHVGQLWLWVVDGDTVITGTSHSPRVGINPQADIDSQADIDPRVGIDQIFERILYRLSGSEKDFNREAILFSIDSFVKFILSFYINVADNLTLDIDLPGSGEELNLCKTQNSDSVSVYTIFATSIEKVNKIENKLRQTFQEQISGISSEHTSDVAENIRNAVTRANKALTAIKDIRGELNMIKSVVQSQQRVWDQLCSNNTQNSSSWKSTDPNYVLSRIQTQLDFAQETEKNVESVLQLHMNQLSLNEAETSRKLAENAGIQAQTVLVFTVVTVIFAPISFLTSLFALNISIFPHSGDMVLYQPVWVFGILFGILAGFSLIVWVAVKLAKPGRLQDLRKDFKDLFPKHKQSDKENKTQGTLQEIHGPGQQPNMHIKGSWYIFPGWNKAFRRWRRNRASEQGDVPA